MGFSRQEYWSGLPFSPLMDLLLSELSTMTRPSRGAPGQSGLHASGEGERVIAPEPW